MRITLAVALVAIMAAFALWLVPRWHLLAETDQTMGVLACLVLGVCAVAIVARRPS